MSDTPETDALMRGPGPFRNGATREELRLVNFARRLERERDEARAERDAEKEEIMTICAAGAESERQLHEAREALREMKELAEFWINREDRRGMCESAWKTWRALGHGSKAMLRARAVLDEGGGR